MIKEDWSHNQGVEIPYQNLTEENIAELGYPMPYFEEPEAQG